MYIENKIFYQVSTDRNYKIGDIFYFGNDLNFQGERTLNGAKTINSRKLTERGFSYVNSNKKDTETMLNMAKYLEEYDFIIRELALEKVRKENFPNLPSRLHCMFLTDNKDSCIKNIKTFHNKGHGTNFQAVSVKCTGKIFFVKDFFVGREGLSFNQYVEKAQKYWTQNQESSNNIMEILFEGRAEIIEIFDEYTHKR